MTTHLVIPDAHAKPKTSMERFKWLGEFIVDLQPDKIICLGDFADMESLCSYDRGKKDYNSRNYKRDVNAAILAQEALFQPIWDYNTKRSMGRRKQYRPEYHMLYGNHEQRISRAVELDSVVLEGLIGLEDLEYERFGWTVYPFLDKVPIDGIMYSHYFVSGVMGRAIGGENPAAALINKHHMSCTAGHTHTYDVARRTRADGSAMRGLVAGCFFDHWEGYAGQANDLWYRGVFVKTNIEGGDYDLQEISLKELERRYG
ncbi:MAG: metallophosphoesterase [Gammaproteobacteria bacterium]|nr:metallophosphoesterase [Gammaproteobacteria bacterium]